MADSGKGGHWAFRFSCFTAKGEELTNCLFNACLCELVYSHSNGKAMQHFAWLPFYPH